MLITKEEAEAKVMMFLPVMKELEAMGYNPVELMFREERASITEIEAVYVAIQKAKAKNPEWYKVATEHLSKLMGETH